MNGGRGLEQRGSQNPIPRSNGAKSPVAARHLGFCAGESAGAAPRLPTDPAAERSLVGPVACSLYSGALVYSVSSLAMLFDDLSHLLNFLAKWLTNLTPTHLVVQSCSPTDSGTLWAAITDTEYVTTVFAPNTLSLCFEVGLMPYPA
jgi:hypothetical protein